MDQEPKPIGVAEGSDVLFAANEERPAADNGYWKVLIVDDEKEVHAVTELALRSFSFEAKSLQFLHAYSGAEALRIIAEQPDIALIFLDVVMESDNAGLAVAKSIRTELNNRMVSIVLRTGQAGLAPEQDIIIAYEIGGYKAKTELTAQKLFSTVVSSLRAYRDRVAIEGSRKSLEKILASLDALFEMRSIAQLVEGLLIQLSALLHVQRGAAICRTAPSGAADSLIHLVLLCGTGEYERCHNVAAEQVLPERANSDLQQALQRMASIYHEDRCAIFFGDKKGNSNLLYLDGIAGLSHDDKRLLESFCANISIAIDRLLRS